MSEPSATAPFIVTGVPETPCVPIENAPLVTIPVFGPA